MKNVKQHFCVICGETDETKFYVKRKNKCINCIKKEYNTLSYEDKLIYINKQKNWRCENLITFRLLQAKHRANRKKNII